MTGELARLTGVLDACGGVGEAGYKSTAGFLRHACGRSPGRAGELVATGRALRRLEATGQALMAGEISFDAAHVICRAAGQIEDDAAALAAEEQMLAAARNQRPDPARRAGAGQQPGPDHAPGGQGSPGGNASPGRGRIPGGDAAPGGQGPGWAAFRTARRDRKASSPGPAGGQGPAGRAGDLRVSRRCRVRRVSWAGGGFPGLDPSPLRMLGEELIYRADPDAVEERERKRFERRHLSFGFTMENTGTISAACGDTLSLEIIKTAVQAFGPPLGSEDTRTAAQRRMDGLTAACQAALDSGTAGTRHGAAPHLSVLVDEQTLAGADGYCASPAAGRIQRRKAPAAAGTVARPRDGCARPGGGTAGAPAG